MQSRYSLCDILWSFMHAKEFRGLFPKLCCDIEDDGFSVCHRSHNSHLLAERRN